jgi:Protein of unknown function (DUF3574)
VTSTFIARLSAIILALIIGAVGVRAYAYAGGSATPAADTAYARQPSTLVPTPTLVPAPAAADLDMRDADARLKTDPFIRTELFFGSERPNKPEVSDVEFKRFLDKEVTPRFPDGLTVLKGFGQFRESDGKIVQESSFVLILLYPRETLRDSSAKIEEIRTLYKERFEQESVLRVDDPRPVRVSF